MTLAWIFPGQGTQFVGMGKALYDESPAARAVFDRADDALGESLSGLCFDGPEADLVLTQNTQPAVLVNSIAALAALREAYPDLEAPSATAGHSLGEYSALVAAEALSLEDAVRLVRLRGRAMQDAVPPGQGAMAAILGGDADKALALCADAGGIVQPANFNAPGQIVIAGESAAVARAVELAGTRKMKAMLLKVSAPFHCQLMAPAARVVADALTRVSFAAPRCPVIGNFDAAPSADPDVLRQRLVSQIDGAVQWEASVRVMAERGVTLALEIGPGKILANMVKRIDSRIRVLPVGDPTGVRDAAATMRDLRAGANSA